MLKHSPDSRKVSDEKTLSKAVSNAAHYWQLGNKDLGDILGLSEATVSRLRHEKYTLPQESKSWQLALLFLRVFRGLDAYLGGHRENERAWLTSPNTALRGVPLEVMKQVEGLIDTMHYVDYIRGH